MPETDFNHHLGLRVARRHKDGVSVECRLRPELMNFSGVLHGGVTATLADVAAGQALGKMLKRHTTTVELKINYLRPITGRKAIARSHFVRIGKTLCIARVDVFDDKRNLSAVALVTYMILDAGTRGAMPDQGPTISPPNTYR